MIYLRRFVVVYIVVYLFFLYSLSFADDAERD